MKITFEEKQEILRTFEKAQELGNEGYWGAGIAMVAMGLHQLVSAIETEEERIDR